MVLWAARICKWLKFHRISNSKVIHLQAKPQPLGTFGTYCSLELSTKALGDTFEKFGQASSLLWFFSWVGPSVVADGLGILSYGIDHGSTLHLVLTLPQGYVASEISTCVLPISNVKDVGSSLNVLGLGLDERKVMNEWMAAAWGCACAAPSCF